MKLLSELFNIDNDMKIYSIHSDSRYVRPFSVFFCIEGLSVDGHQYVDDAIFQGAKVIVHSKELHRYQDDIIYIHVPDTLAQLNRCANIFYDEPSKHMKMIGITGTDGKTCVTSMIKQSLETFCKTGMIGTLSIEYDNIIRDMTFTTPVTVDLHRYLFQMRYHGVKVVAMEVSSHGLTLRRVDSIHFDMAIMTNIREEHLDFHGTFEHYQSSKRKLFEMLDENGLAILNKDDSSYQDFKEHTKARIMTYAIEKEADIMARDIKLSLTKTNFELYVRGNWYQVETKLLGKHNVYNTLALVCALVGIGCDEEMILKAIGNVKPASGRMELVEHPNGPTVIIDYCQYPENFKNALKLIKSIKSPTSNLITVFGAPAKRNIQNRYLLGSIANQYCDQVIITNLDQRDEDVFQIGEMIEAGISKIPSVIVGNRQIAIEQALMMASKKDIVFIAGKGHEQFMALDVGKTDYPGDKQVVLNTLDEIYQGDDSNS